MIARLSGKIAHIEANVVIVDVNGVGYKVSAPVSSLMEIGSVGDAVVMHTHTYVREDELSLYGFTQPEQLKAFELLIGVTGIGPKVALAILSAMDAGSLAHAVSVGDTRTLVKVPGLGPKTAQRLVLELSDKMASLSFSTRAAMPVKSGQPKLNASDQFFADIVEGLVGLGYNRKDSERAADRVIRESEPGETLTSAKALREALNVLTGNR